MKKLTRYPVDEILPLTGITEKRFFTVNDKKYSVKMCSLRFLVFKKSCKCSHCKRVGTIMGLDLCTGDRNPHFNLYAIDGDREEVLMTKDHIVPSSKGGKDEIGNLQTMCVYCNRRKGNGDKCRSQKEN